MALSKSDIEWHREVRDLEITRTGGDVKIEPSSVDLHLGENIGHYEKQKQPIRVDDEDTYPRFWNRFEGGEILIKPGEFLLGYTEEVVNLPSNIVGYLQGRSSVGRLGLFVENAGLVDAGFHGDLTLELYNASKNTISLEPGMRICQLMLHEHENAPEVAYSEQNGNKYQGQRGPTASRLYEDFE